MEFLEQLKYHQLINKVSEFTNISAVASSLLGCYVVSVDYLAMKIMAL
jgi:hypothetical protein